MNEERGLFARVRTFVVVTLIAMMLWLLAESRMVRSRSVEAQLAITMADSTGGPELAVRQTPEGDRVRVVEIEIEGSTSGIDELVRQLQNRVELRLGREIPARPGVFEIDLRTELRRSPDLDMHGVTIAAVSPETIRVEVDEIETREFELRVELPEGVRTDGPPRAEPALVQVRAPGSVMADLRGDSGVLSITLDQISQLDPGRLETIPGRLVEFDGLGSAAWATTIEPAQADVLLTLASVTQRLALDQIPVQVLLAPGEVGRWRVEIDDSDRDLIGIEVEGPVSGIEALRDRSVRPRAFVSLSFEDLERRVDSAPAQIVNLPPGCAVIGSMPNIGLRITPVTGADAGNDPPAAPSP